MIHWIVNKKIKQAGFTLIETLVVIIMVGIMASLSAPSILGMINRSKVNKAYNELKGAFSEIQRQAIKKSKSCNVTIPNSGTIEPTIESNCFILGDRKLYNVKIRHNASDVLAGYSPGTAASLFNFQGVTAPSGATPFLSGNLIIVLSHKDNSATQKCIVVSSGLGLIRTGTYPANDTGTTANNCKSDN